MLEDIKIQKMALTQVREELSDTGSNYSLDNVVNIINTKSKGILELTALYNQVNYVHSELAGLGKLERLLLLPNITDILVVGTQGVWVDTGNGLRLTEIKFTTDEQVRELATRLSVQSGARLDDSHPWVDTIINSVVKPEYHIRMHCILNLIAKQGTCISIRILKPAVTTLTDLQQAGTFPLRILPFIKKIISNKISYLISGGTGSGKTTLLAALLGEVSQNERIICIEDARELTPSHSQIINLIARESNLELKGEITLSQLVKQSLRMRPDRIVIGEVRGKEVVDLLTALNTGHKGGAGTIHANSAEEVLARLEFLGALAGFDRRALHSLVAAALKIILSMQKLSNGKQILGEISRLVRLETGMVKIERLWHHQDLDNSLLDSFIDEDSLC